MNDYQVCKEIGMYEPYKEKKQWIETDPEMTQKIELVEKKIK